MRRGMWALGQLVCGVIVGAVVVALISSGGCIPVGGSAAGVEAPSRVVPHSAADYVFVVDGVELADVRVSARGVYLTRERGRERLGVETLQEIRNRSMQPLVLDFDASRVDALTHDGRLVRDIRLAEVRGVGAVAPGEARSVHFYFLLPEGIEVAELSAYQLRWHLRSGGAWLPGQRTLFVAAWDATHDAHSFFPVELVDLERDLSSGSLSASGVRHVPWREVVALESVRRDVPNCPAGVKCDAEVQLRPVATARR